MARFSIQILETTGTDFWGQMLYDLTPFAQNTVFETDQHGFSFLRTTAIMNRHQAMRLYDEAPNKFLRVTDGFSVVWEGRVEDRRLIAGGVEVRAFGYWSALDDVLYTAQWSKTGVRDWIVLEEDDRNGVTPDIMVMRVSRELHWGLRKGETYAQATTFPYIGYETPAGSRTDIRYLTFDYEMFLPTQIGLRVDTGTGGFTGGFTFQSFTAGTGATQTGTITVTPGANTNTVIIWLRPTATFSPTTDTGARYCRVFNLRVAQSSTVNNKAIVGDVLDAVNELGVGENIGHFSFDRSAIRTSLFDIRDVSYYDQSAARVISDLAALGDPNDSDGGAWEAAVWENRVLRFNRPGAWASEYFADALSLDLSSSLDGVRNIAYAVFKGPRGERAITSSVKDRESSERFGFLLREASVSVSTEDQSAAEQFRDVLLTESADQIPRATITIGRLYNQHGAPVPPYMVRAGDTITIRNMIALGLEELNQISSFRVRRTSYDVDRGVMRVQPRFETPTLDQLVARNAIGVVSTLGEPPTIPSGFVR